MRSTTFSALLLAMIFCGWPLFVHVAILWIGRRDWSHSGDVLSQIISIIFNKQEDK